MSDESRDETGEKKEENQLPVFSAFKGVGGDDALVEALKQVIDPELNINIVDLGLVYEILRSEDDPSKVTVSMTLTSPACPAGPQIITQAKMALERVDDVNEATIQLTMTPPWSPDLMTDDARDELGIF
ncbi:MAG: metal-sulfur cluster assembly factor [Gimesia chilikensis]|uniref:metal-sulfur cluster assembly factor n=1 Tax=Gimesia chilikensis TaxID=2605989 RepID=UPI0011EC6CF8|nr:metal-sulfur cluster assembly factor [Gimesia chilikensis]KAA0137801.1 metal-sulfur cluster assembly factor [Gimesia chilikensis]